MDSTSLYRYTASLLEQDGNITCKDDDFHFQSKQRSRRAMSSIASENKIQNAEPAAGPELSVVLPCLNEARTLATCITQIQQTARAHGIAAEIIVADNGSTDGSAEIATSLGARVVPVAAKGYGNALMGGIAAAHGRYVIMGDADCNAICRPLLLYICQRCESWPARCQPGLSTNQLLLCKNRPVGRFLRSYKRNVCGQRVPHRYGTVRGRFG